jgi:transcriptional regulator GlxA family with amidase domain
VAADPAGDYSLASLAALANVSPRHLTRRFRDELGTTPAKYPSAAGRFRRGR